MNYREKAHQVLQIIINNHHGSRITEPASLKTLQQIKLHCNEACIARFLKAEGNSVTKAAKKLQSHLSWRASHDIDNITADEFLAELAHGFAFVLPSCDDDGRPIVILRNSVQLQNLWITQKGKFMRFFAFTMEVAIAAMEAPVAQCVFIIDSKGHREDQQIQKIQKKKKKKKKKKKMQFVFCNVVVHVLKLVSEHYPQRIARVFFIDAPPLFFYTWKLGLCSSLIRDPQINDRLTFVSSREYHHHRNHSHNHNHNHHHHHHHHHSYNDVNTSAAVLHGSLTPAGKLIPKVIKDQGMIIRALPDPADPAVLRASAVSNSASSSDSSPSSSDSSDFSSTTANYCTSPASCSSNPIIKLTRSPNYCSTNAAWIDHRRIISSCVMIRSQSYTSTRRRECVNAQDAESHPEITDHAMQMNQIIAAPDPAADHMIVSRRNPIRNRIRSCEETSIDEFVPYYMMLISQCASYDERIYRSIMKPPLGGLISIVSPVKGRSLIAD